MNRRQYEDVLDENVSEEDVSDENVSVENVSIENVSIENVSNGNVVKDHNYEDISTVTHAKTKMYQKNFFNYYYQL